MKDKLFSQAKQAREKAYAPYSKFKVGAAIRTATDAIFCGCNVENASFGLTLCAEVSAIATMVTQVGTSEIQEVAVVGSSQDYCYPCGACLQRLQEFASAEMVVHVTNGLGETKTLRFQELLPFTFNAKSIST